MEQKRVFLLPGELYISREPALISTILGSCVGVVLFNRKHKFGGMNHFMLPQANNGDIPNGKHGDYSTEMLIKMMLAEDSNIGNLEASILGGGNVNGHLSVGTGIGANNIVVANNIVKKFNIWISGENVGGDFGRKVHFNNSTGEMQVNRIQKSIFTETAEKKKKEFSSRKIKVLIVDDSATVRAVIGGAVSEDPDIEVIGGAADPYEAREMLLEYDPDVICLDIIMPRLDGISFLKKIFQYKPKPVIIISTVAKEGSKLREQAEKIGAVDVIDKEDLRLYVSPDMVKSILINKIKAAARLWVTKKSKDELERI